MTLEELRAQRMRPRIAAKKGDNPVPKRQYIQVLRNSRGNWESSPPPVAADWGDGATIHLVLTQLGAQGFELVAWDGESYWLKRQAAE